MSRACVVGQDGAGPAGRGGAGGIGRDLRCRAGPVERGGAGRTSWDPPGSEVCQAHPAQPGASRTS